MSMQTVKMIPVEQSKLKNHICKARICLSHQLKQFFPLHFEVSSCFYSPINVCKFRDHSIYLKEEQQIELPNNRSLYRVETPKLERSIPGEHSNPEQYFDQEHYQRYESHQCSNTATLYNRVHLPSMCLVSALLSPHTLNIQKRIPSKHEVIKSTKIKRSICNRTSLKMEGNKLLALKLQFIYEFFYFVKQTTDLVFNLLLFFHW